jgi:hypothetical protein
MIERGSERKMTLRHLIISTAAILLVFAAAYGGMLIYREFDNRAVLSYGNIWIFADGRVAARTRDNFIKESELPDYMARLDEMKKPSNFEGIPINLHVESGTSGESLYNTLAAVCGEGGRNIRISWNDREISFFGQKRIQCDSYYVTLARDDAAISRYIENYNDDPDNRGLISLRPVNYPVNNEIEITIWCFTDSMSFYVGNINSFAERSREEKRKYFDECKKEMKNFEVRSWDIIPADNILDVIRTIRSSGGEIINFQEPNYERTSG